MADDTAECANPLLLQWVGELLDKARERNTKGFHAYKKAYDAIKANPLTFDHPSESKMLAGVGDKLSKYLTEKMEAYCEENGLPKPTIQRKGKKRTQITAADGEGQSQSPSPSKKRKHKSYVPKLRSGGYGIILALATLPKDSQGYTKEQTIELAQKYSDSSYTVPVQSQKFYTAWKSVDTLITHELVWKKGSRPHRFSLSEEGRKLAKSFQKALSPGLGGADTFTSKDETSGSKKYARDFNDSGSDPEGPSPFQDSIGVPDVIPRGTSSALPTFDAKVLQLGTFEVRLVLDNREVFAKSGKGRSHIQDQLAKHGIEPIVKPLALGDILWVAKLHNQTLPDIDGGSDEIVLDYVVERKRLDDLVSSIKDGRFHEQKFRLRKSGMKNIIYLIEEFDMHGDKYEEAVQSAIVSTQAVNGYFVKKTKHMDETINYLVRMTKLLKNIYESKPLHVIPHRMPNDIITDRNYLPLLEHLRTKKPGVDHNITYTAFASLASKSDTLTLRDVYLKMLMCTRGVTGEKALEIQKIWKTPAEFVEAFEKCGDGEEGRKRKMALVSSKLGNMVGRKKIAKVLSVKISGVWGGVGLDA